MATEGFQTSLGEEVVLPNDAAGWIDLFVGELNIPEITSYSDLMVYLEQNVKEPDQEGQIKGTPHYWDLYLESLKDSPPADDTPRKSS